MLAFEWAAWQFVFTVRGSQQGNAGVAVPRVKPAEGALTSDGGEISSYNYDSCQLRSILGLIMAPAGLESPDPACTRFEPITIPVTLSMVLPFAPGFPAYGA